jgi:Domain of unknown function (DUF4395)
MTHAVRTLDPNVLRFNQICIVGLIALAAVVGQWWIVAAVGVVMLGGTWNSSLAAFKRLYSSVVRPALKIPVNAIQDDPRAHNFAQGVGGVFLALATLAFVAGAPILGWALAAIVVALAMLNLTTGVCVGCFMYFHLRLLQHRLRRA